MAPRILRYFPKGASRIVEPFAGSAAMTIAIASRHLAEKFWINDAHKPLMALWGEIIENPDTISLAYTKLWNAQLGNERDFFNLVRSRFNKSHRPEDFLYLLARCVKASIRYNSNGEFNNTPDNRRKGAHPDEMCNRIAHTSMLLSGRIKITAWDYKKVLEKCTESDFVYMDPPYQGVCGNRDNRYLPKIEFDEFCMELEKLNDRNIRYIISYDGRTGEKEYGQPMPGSLGLTRIEMHAGRSTQSTLLGRSDITYESLYLSPNLSPTEIQNRDLQMSLW
ncbi:MAG: DNA adenine methylase [Sedimentisphaerales bacterium]|nr:DNA adenine methylase [Sedimentisphaerales bacterium]